jgi:hypothetical protein
VQLDVEDHEGFRPEVIDGDIEEPLNLTGVQVHRDNVIAPSDGHHVGDELGGDRRARFLLLVHPRVRETGHDGGDAARRSGFASGDEDEEFHEVVVDVGAASLDDEDVFVADGFQDLGADLSVAEFFH